MPMLSVALGSTAAAPTATAAAISAYSIMSCPPKSRRRHKSILRRAPAVPFRCLGGIRFLSGNLTQTGGDKFAPAPPAQMLLLTRCRTGHDRADLGKNRADAG